MRSRLIFRQHAHIVPTNTPWLLRTEWLWSVFALACLVVVFGLAGYWDQRAENEQALQVARHRAALARAYEAGVEQGHAQMVATATAAWEAAQAEAETRGCNIRRLP